MARAFRHGWLLAFVVVIGFGAAKPADAAGPLEKTIFLTGPRYDGALPACDAALGSIQSKFSQKESQFWNSNLQILGFERVQEIAFRVWAPESIPRRYCSAEAAVSDGLKHKVYYWIGEDTGMIGMTWGVEWCVDGLDRNWAYNPHCKMARP